MPGVPLSVLDLVPVSSGRRPADAVRNAIDLAAQHAERLGYRRYWFAEHHLNPGVAGTVPSDHDRAVALPPPLRSRRLGRYAASGHRTTLSGVEEFGLLDTFYPGRLDLGLGRSADARRQARNPAVADTARHPAGEAHSVAGTGPERMVWPRTGSNPRRGSPSRNWSSHPALP